MANDEPGPEARRGGEDDFAAPVYARRERHRRRPLAVRVLSAVAGSLVALVGVVLLIPLPEVGVPATLAGLGLLALEFEWAARALERVELAWARFKQLPLAVRLGVAIVLAAILVLAVVVLI